MGPLSGGWGVGWVVLQGRDRPGVGRSGGADRPQSVGPTSPVIEWPSSGGRGAAGGARRVARVSLCGRPLVTV